MKIKKDNFSIILFSSAAIVILGSTLLSVRFKPLGKRQVETSPQLKEQEQVSLVIRFDEETRGLYQSDFQKGDTAFSVLKNLSEKEGVTLETTEYDFGVFVNAIGGVKTTTDKAWIYFVNQESGNVAADQYLLKPGDVVEWRYIEPEL